MDPLSRAAHAARLGDERALERFIAASYNDVRRLCSLLVDDQAADDLAQETFLRAMRALQRFRGSASARTWILSIARRVCVDELRLRDRQRRRHHKLASAAMLEGAGPDPAGEITIYALLSSLDPDRRAAFVLTQHFRLSSRGRREHLRVPAGHDPLARRTSPK